MRTATGLNADERLAKPAYLTSVDGLRAISVALVVLYHHELATFGWSGVWVFFVISGFVITRSALGYPPAPLGASLRRFYTRRVRRILPLYLLILVLGSVMAIAARHRDQLAHLPWLLTGTYNFYRMSPAYLDVGIFGHLWSLSVEEQFYAVFPFLFFRLRRERLIAVLLAAVGLCPFVRWELAHLLLRAGWTPELAGNAVYQFSIGHFDAFAAGCLLALHETRIVRARWLAGAALAAAAACLTLYAWLTGGPATSFVARGFHINVITGGGEVLAYLSIELLAVAALIACMQRLAGVDTVLRWPWLAAVGERSYGVYVYHVPTAFAFWALFRHTGLPFALGFAVYAASVLGIASVSYERFEGLFRRPRAAKGVIMGVS